MLLRCRATRAGFSWQRYGRSSLLLSPGNTGMIGNRLLLSHQRTSFLRMLKHASPVPVASSARISSHGSLTWEFQSSGNTPCHDVSAAVQFNNEPLLRKELRGSSRWRRARWDPGGWPPRSPKERAQPSPSFSPPPRATLLVEGGLDSAW